MRIALLGPWTCGPLLPWLGTAASLLPEGGRGMVVTLLAAELLAQGHQVEVITLDDDVKADVVVEVGSLKVTALPRRASGRGRDAYGVERRRLRQVVADLDAEVVNPHWSYEYALATADIRLPRVVTIHDWAPSILFYSPDPYRLVRLGMYAAALRSRPRATVPSPQMARRLRAAGLRDVAVVPNGLDASRMGPGPRSARAGAEVLSVADGFGRLKNTRAVIDAMPLIRRHVPDATLSLVGPQHDPTGPAHDYAVAAGLNAGISFLGFRPHADVIARMRRSALLVHPAREESFGMVLIEAMAQGTPVIGGDRSGAVPWVLQGGAGSLVDVGSPAQIAAAAVELLTDQTRWADRSRAGFAAVTRRFTMPVVARGYLDAYAAACEDGSR